MSVSTDVRVALRGVAECWHAGVVNAHKPLGRAHLPAVLFLLGVTADSVTTSFVNLVPGVAEGNPLAAAGMDLLGSPQAFMALALMLLAPLTVLVAGRPRTVLARGMWCALLATGMVKLALGLSNTHLLLAAYHH